MLLIRNNNLCGWRLKKERWWLLYLWMSSTYFRIIAALLFTSVKVNIVKCKHRSEAVTDGCCCSKVPRGVSLCKQTEAKISHQTTLYKWFIFNISDPAVVTSVFTCETVSTVLLLLIRNRANNATIMQLKILLSANWSQSIGALASQESNVSRI